MLRNGEYLNGIIATLQRPKFIEAVREVSSALCAVRNHNGRVYLCGNGGSSAIASHFAQDLRKSVVPGMKAFCLSDNVSFLTATANDSDYGKVFADALVVEELGKRDALIGISCSCNSENVLQAMQEAVRADATIIAMIGHKECQVVEQFLRYDKMVFFYGLHPDIRGQEDLISIGCHMIVGEMS